MAIIFLLPLIRYPAAAVHFIFSRKSIRYARRRPFLAARLHVNVSPRCGFFGKVFLPCHVLLLFVSLASSAREKSAATQNARFLRDGGLRGTSRHECPGASIISQWRRTARAKISAGRLMGMSGNWVPACSPRKRRPAPTWLDKRRSSWLPSRRRAARTRATGRESRPCTGHDAAARRLPPPRTLGRSLLGETPRAENRMCGWRVRTTGDLPSKWARIMMRPHTA